MKIAENELTVLHKLIELEKTIGKLYRIYANKFPEHQKFWSILASEEIEHANWLLMLQGQIKHGNIRFQKNRFNIWGIENSLDYVRHKISFAQDHEILFTKASSIALDLEKSLLERKYYECYKSDCPEIKKILRDLKYATKDHRNRIQKVLDKKLKINA